MDVYMKKKVNFLIIILGFQFFGIESKSWEYWNKNENDEEFRS